MERKQPVKRLEKGLNKYVTIDSVHEFGTLGEHESRPRAFFTMAELSTGNCTDIKANGHMCLPGCSFWPKLGELVTKYAEENNMSWMEAYRIFRPELETTENSPETMPKIFEIYKYRCLIRRERMHQHDR